MLSRLKSLPLTIVLTILIWMYAEAQFTSIRENVRLDVKIYAPNPEIALRVIDAQGNPRSFATLNVTLQGPKNQIDRIYQQTQSAGLTQDEEFLQLNYEPPASLLQPALASADDNTIDSKAMLNSLRYFRQRSVIITSAVPERVKLDVDFLQHVERQVEFRPTVPVTHFSLLPERVTVNIPARTLTAIGADKVNVIARTQRDLATLPPDTDQIVPVTYFADYPGPRDERITVTPAQGTVSIRVPRLRGVSQVVPEIPVWVAGPPALLAKYDVELRTKTVKVTVAGSQPAIEALRQAMLPKPGVVVNPAMPSHGVRAYLDLTAEDRPSEGFTARRVRYIFPEGLTLQEAAADVEFRLVVKVNGK
jgi:hypothetical protein